MRWEKKAFGHLICVRTGNSQSKLVTYYLLILFVLLEYHRALYWVLFSSVFMLITFWFLQKYENAAVHWNTVLFCHVMSTQYKNLLKCSQLWAMVPVSYVQLALSRDDCHANRQRTKFLLVRFLYVLFVKVYCVYKLYCFMFSKSALDLQTKNSFYANSSTFALMLLLIYQLMCIVLIK